LGLLGIKRAMGLNIYFLKALGKNFERKVFNLIGFFLGGKGNAARIKF
jgi:hypothetical protein